MRSGGSTVPLRCPSAQPEMPQAQVLGVVRQTADGPRVSYVSGVAPVTEDLLSAATPSPTMVLRFAAQCEMSRCRHFGGGSCTLASRIAMILPKVTQTLPACSIRRSCRWFAEQGGTICLRCSQVVTLSEREQVDPSLIDGPSL